MFDHWQSNNAWQKNINKYGHVLGKRSNVKFMASPPTKQIIPMQILPHISRILRFN